LDEDGWPKKKLPPTELMGCPWRTLLDRWNKVYPEGHEWHYEHVRNFERDFRRAEAAVAFPNYDLSLS
jgi:hypothetical protein